MQNTLVQTLLIFGLADLDLQGQIKLKSQNLIIAQFDHQRFATKLPE